MNLVMQFRKVCNHPDLFEPRPIVSPMTLKPLKISVPYICQYMYPCNEIWGTTSIFDFNFCNERNFGNDDPWVMQRVKALATDLPETVNYIEKMDVEGLRNFLPQTNGNGNNNAINTLIKTSKSIHFIKEKEKNKRRNLLLRINRMRCFGPTSTYAMYNKSLIHACFVRGDADDAIRKAKNPREYFNYTSYLRKLILTHYERTIRIMPTVEKFILYIPPAAAPRPDVHRTREFPMMKVNRRRTRKALKKFAENDHLLRACHVSMMMRRVLFPDKWLVQYDCGKLQVLDKLLHRLKREGHRCLIFTQMTKMLNVLENFMCLHGHTYFRLDGATHVEKRQSLTERFNRDPKIFSFILSTRSGGLGINLVGADTVIFYDTDWNPAMDAQAQDRAHRIGQTRDVHIYRLVTEHTVEENIIMKANQKRHLNMLSIEQGKFTTDFFAGSSAGGPKASDMKDLLEGTGAVIREDEDEEDAVKAMAAAEDDDDQKAIAATAKERMKDVAEFDETKKLEVDAVEDAAKPKISKKAQAAAMAEAAEKENEMLEQNLIKLWQGNDESNAMQALESALRPIDRYAIHYRQDMEPIWNNAAADAWRKEVMLEASNREWEVEQIELQRIKEEKELETSTDYVRAAPSKRGYGRSKRLFLNLRESRDHEEKRRRVSGGEWTLYFDEKLKRNYYFNSRTGKCTWTKPLVLAIRDAQVDARQLLFGGFPPALLRLILLYCGTKDRLSSSMVCLHWYTVVQHRSMWLRVIPNYKLRAAPGDGNHFRSTKLWGDDWFFEYGMGDSGIGLPRTHHSQKSIFDITVKDRIFDTITEALAQAIDGEAIAIEPGAYNEGSVEISKKVRFIAGDGEGDIYHGIRPLNEEDNPGSYKSVSIDGALKTPLVNCILKNDESYKLTNKSSCVFLGVQFSRARQDEKDVDENNGSSSSSSTTTTTTTKKKGKNNAVDAVPILKLEHNCKIRMYYCSLIGTNSPFIKIKTTGLEIHKNSEAFVTDSEVKGLNADGVKILDGSKIVINNSNVAENAGTGIYGNSNGRLVLSKSRVKDNKSYGIHLEGNSFRALIDKNIIVSNGKGQVKYGKGVKVLNE